ncbi:MAG: hypothetical protein ACJ79K_05880 [Gemmatimonadaceae bacterium]
MQITTTARAILFFAFTPAFVAPLYAQTHEHPAELPAATTAAVPSADATRAFTLIKSLAGRWQGSLINPENGKPVTMEASIRVTSHGNSIVHEMKGAGDADDGAKSDHPVTMMYLDGANLILTHFCDAGNRPRMAARLSPDGKQVDFDFIDVAGPVSHGHMQHVRISIVDSTHHLEEWTWALPNGKTMSAPMELHRVETIAALPAK